MYPMGSWFTVAPDATPAGRSRRLPWPSDDGSLIVPAYTGGGLSVSSSAPDVDKAKEWAIAYSQVTENLEGGVTSDGLFVSLKDFKVPAGTTKLYDETLAIYNDAVSTGTVRPLSATKAAPPRSPPASSPKSTRQSAN